MAKRDRIFALRNFIQIIALAGAFCSAGIGAIFTSGQVALQFFASYGIYSFIALVVSAILFAWMSSTLFIDGFHLQLERTSDIFAYYAGKEIGALFRLVFVIVLYGFYIVLVAGAGALINQQLDISDDWGRAIMALASGLTVTYGLRRIVHILSFVGPILMLATIVVGTLGLFLEPLSIMEADQYTQTLKIPQASPYWWLSALLYPGVIFFMTASILVGVGEMEVTSKKNAVKGGILGGIAFTIITALVSTSMLLDVDDIYNKQAPLLYIAADMVPILGDALLYISLAAAYITIIPILWSITNIFADDKTIKYNIITLVLVIISYVIGDMVEFNRLINIVMPKIGYIGLIFMGFVAYSQLKRLIKIKNQT